jgi:hypothetical protein
LGERGFDEKFPPLPAVAMMKQDGREEKCVAPTKAIVLDVVS